MKRIDILKALAGSHWGREAFIISNIGYPSRELYAIGDRKNYFYMLGSMGLASSIGLGVSLASNSKEVIVVDGDSSVLMNLGTLSTIANFAKENYHLLIVDNEANGSTGNQPSHTALGTDLVEISRGAGVRDVLQINRIDDLSRLLDRNRLPTVIVAKCEASNAKVPVIPLSAGRIKSRFVRAINSTGPAN